MNLLCIGDSITWGAWDSRGGWVARVRERIDTHFFGGDLNDFLLTYNLGVSGDTTKDVLRRIDGELSARGLPERNIAGAVVALGTNDSSYRHSLGSHAVTEDGFASNIDTILQTLLRATDNVIALGLPSVDESKTHPYIYNDDVESFNDDICRYEEIIRDVTRRLDTQFVPLFDDFSASDPISMLWTDGVHLNDKGHDFVANALWSHLQPMIDSFRR